MASRIYGAPMSKQSKARAKKQKAARRRQRMARSAMYEEISLDVTMLDSEDPEELERAAAELRMQLRGSRGEAQGGMSGRIGDTESLFHVQTGSSNPTIWRSRWPGILGQMPHRPGKIGRAHKGTTKIFVGLFYWILCRQTSDFV